MTDKSLYSKDFVAWAEQQALFLEAEEFQRLDLANLIEEVRGMSRLKLRVQPDYSDKKSWVISIKDARVELEESMVESTVLNNKLLNPETLARCYAKAVVQASNEID